jgi:hypothetical protein
MSKIWLGWVISLILVVGTSVVNLHYFPVPNIIAIEFARDATTMFERIQANAPQPAEAYHLLLDNTIVDYGFILAYTALILFSVRITLGGLEARGGRWFYWLGAVPGIMDGIENSFLIATAIRQHETISWLYLFVVRIKWGVAILFYMLIPLLFLYGLILLFRARQQP